MTVDKKISHDTKIEITSLTYLNSSTWVRISKGTEYLL